MLPGINPKKPRLGQFPEEVTKTLLFPSETQKKRGVGWGGHEASRAWMMQKVVAWAEEAKRLYTGFWGLGFTLDVRG